MQTETTLKALVERYPFVAHIETIKAISERATQERVMQAQLEAIQKEWLRAKIRVAPLSEALRSGHFDAPALASFEKPEEGGLLAIENARVNAAQLPTEEVMEDR